jgi:hypothetical protein
MPTAPTPLNPLNIPDPTNNEWPQEYVASQYVLSYGILQNRVLPNSIDDLTRGLRDDIYEQMLLDPQVKSCIGLYIDGVLGGGIKVLPSSPDGEEPDEESTQAAYFIRDMLDNLETPLITHILPDMLKAKALGNRVAEMVCYKPGEGPFPGKLALKALKIKHRRAVCFVVDAFLNMIGFVPSSIGGAGLFDMEEFIIPPSKFLYLSWRPENANPLGTSDLRSAYIPWWYKQQVLPEFIKYMTQFASPSMVGHTAEGAIPVPQRDAQKQVMVDANNQPLMIDPAVKMLEEVEKFKNSSVLILPFGASLDNMQVNGNGEIFFNFFRMVDQWIAKTILYQTLATEQAEGQGKAASGVHQDVLAVGVKYGINAVESMLYHQIAVPFTRMNFPNARPPRIHLPGCDWQDFLSRASAIAKLEQTGYIDPSQYRELDSLLGLPARSDSSIQMAIDKKKAEVDAIQNPVASGMGGAVPPSPSGNSSRKSQMVENQNTSP